MRVVSTVARDSINQRQHRPKKGVAGRNRLGFWYRYNRHQRSSRNNHREDDFAPGRLRDHLPSPSDASDPIPRFYRNISAAYVMAITLCSYSYKLSLDALHQVKMTSAMAATIAQPTQPRDALSLSPSVEHSRPLSVVLVRPVLFHRWRRWSFDCLL